MRGGGFPCRASLSCDEVFRVVDQSSIDSLRAASALRSAHEVRDHDYHHQVQPEPLARTFTSINKRQAP